MPAVTMIVSAAAIILLVKFGLLRGINHVAGAMNWSVKTRGQLTGYATSVPEFVCLVSAGLSGVWDAGLWNIASSNIINVVLLLIAMAYYRQFGELFHRRFLDEMIFTGLAIAVPIVLMHWHMDTNWIVIPLLLAFFVIYQLIDRNVNRSTLEQETPSSSGSLPLGLIIGVTALVAIVVAGFFLGEATAGVVEQLGVQPALAGWILGFVTSIPEMVSFFAVFAVAKRAGGLGQLQDTQEALDNLTGSNMANVGFVYPIGLLAYLLATWLLAA